MAHFTEEERLRYRLNAALKKAVRAYDLIADGDRLLVGLSGGKDSLALVELLGDMSQIFRPRFSVSAVHVVMEGIPYQSDLDYLERHCRDHHVAFEVRHASLSSRPSLSPVAAQTAVEAAASDKEKSVCFLCSWNRRKALFEAAKALDCNKIVLGHHREDFLETLLLNMLFQGSIQAIPPKLKMAKFPMEIIRPLCLVAEADLERFARMNAYAMQEQPCPWEHATKRTYARQLLERLEAEHPGVKDSLWASMQHIYPEYLPPAPRAHQKGSQSDLAGLDGALGED